MSAFRSIGARVISRAPLVTLVGTLFALVVFRFPSLASALELQRGVAQSTELWRFLTAHFVHFDEKHMAVDVLTFALLGSACEWFDARRARWTLGIAAISISLSVLWFAPQLNSYRGLSGIDAALFTFLGAELWRRHRESNDASFGAVLRLLPLLLFLLKVISEVVTGSALFVVSSAYESVPIAHLVGGLTGLVIGTRMFEAPPVKFDSPALPYVYAEGDWFNELD